jgi:stage II sporulation protein D
MKKVIKIISIASLLLLPMLGGCGGGVAEVRIYVPPTPSASSETSEESASTPSAPDTPDTIDTYINSLEDEKSEASTEGASSEDTDNRDTDNGDSTHERIRVLVQRGDKTLHIKGSTMGTIDVRADKDGNLIINEKGIVKDALRLKPKPNSNGIIYVNKKPYRGIIEIRPAWDGLLVIDDILLEEYLVGLINKEISSKWPVESIKAQAVIARTYALYKKAERAKKATSVDYDLTGTNLHQVYGGATGEDKAARGAVWKTRGEVLMYKGGLALTVYHSNAGGITEASKDVWGSDFSYLRSVKSPYDKGSRSYSWSLSLSGKELGEKLRGAGFDLGVIKKIKIKKTSRTGRVKSLLIKDTRGGKAVIKGEDLRKAIGYATLRSTLFEVKNKRKSFKFTGFGSGHGVGLSQWGAKGMADAGKSYEKILKHYYKGTKIKRAY